MVLADGFFGGDLREDDLFLHAEAVVAAAVEGARRHAAEVADARHRHVDQPVEELVHARAAQRDLAADRAAVADLEGRDRLARLGHDAASGRRSSPCRRPRSSMTFLSATASPTPMLSVILVMRGTCMGFVEPRLLHAASGRRSRGRFLQPGHAAMSDLHSGVHDFAVGLEEAHLAAVLERPDADAIALLRRRVPAA